MNELCDTKEIVEKLKDIISRQPSFKGSKVFNKNVADLLGITEMNFATMRRRNKIPFKEIMLLCDRCGLDPRELIFKKSC